MVIFVIFWFLKFHIISSAHYLFNLFLPFSFQLLHLGLFLLVCSLNFIPSLRKSLNFHIISFGFVILMMSIWSYFHQQNVLLWLFEFCTQSHKRVSVISNKNLKTVILDVERYFLMSVFTVFIYGA